MARSCECGTCGARIKPKAKDMSLGAAVRLHYWRVHRDVMLAAGTPAATRKRRKATARSGS